MPGMVLSVAAISAPATPSRCSDPPACFFSRTSSTSCVFSTPSPPPRPAVERSLSAAAWLGTPRAVAPALRPS